MSKVESSHSLTIADDGALVFTCDAPQGSACRLVCVADCEDYHRPDCDRSTKDSGECGALIYLNNDGAEDIYTGTTDRTSWDSSPIETEWDSYYDSWVWRYPGEETDLPTYARDRNAG
ncbi:hypothetical protein [Mycolicibacterium llatzerense]|uniref:hypothetical protein n=1 Tax=Mycolicibacterium llatzerense TaxID=280871 RepID=UPI0008DD3EBB|nr:hypothetical protein [Mycolicibacterium llatzerense]